ncbi:MAG: hypothetical protein LUG16_09015, partial [Candidatus Gastranaerophilales bacterium]|nr:hypothetical protein [Candidatus Gastranaerophilales bacterium]
MHILNELTYINKSSLALGFFDGIHQGHRVVIKNAVNIAKENNTQSTVIMFKEHPLNFLTNQKIPLILTENERLKMLEELGVDNIVLLDFEKFSNIKAQTYIKDILVKYYSPIAITTGFNHEFGYNKEGNADILRECQTKYGFKYYEIPPYVYDNTVVSCSSIRNSISAGDLQKANKLLGYEFFINSPVIQGEQIARQIGFPSANAVYPEEKIKIPYGVYFVKVVIDNKEYTGVMNYGF